MQTQFKILEEDIDENYEPTREGNKQNKLFRNH